MSKISIRLLKKNIISGNIKHLYYFTGEELFLLENFTNKIFEICLGENYKKSVDFFLFSIETININNLLNAVNMFPISSERKCILIKGTSFDEMNADLLKKISFILSDIPEFCTIIIHDFSKNNKKSTYYSNFISKISEIAECSEFKHEKSSTEKQAIIWAKKFNKILNDNNSRLLCEKCSNDLNLIKNSIENLCVSLEDNEITEKSIEELNIKFDKKCSIFDICKYIREKDLYKSLKTVDALISQKEDPIKIFSIISSDFIDASRVKILLSSGEQLSTLSKIFNYSGKEFKIHNARHLCEAYDTEKSIKILLNTDILLKTSSISPKFLINRALVEMISA